MKTLSFEAAQKYALEQQRKQKRKKKGKKENLKQSNLKILLKYIIQNPTEINHGLLNLVLRDKNNGKN